MNVELTIVCEKIEDLREAGATLHATALVMSNGHQTA